MKLIMAMLAAVVSVTANSAIVRADPQSVEATEDAAKAEYRATKKHAKADYKTTKAKCRSMKGSEKDGCLNRQRPATPQP